MNIFLSANATTTTTDTMIIRIHPSACNNMKRWHIKRNTYSKNSLIAQEGSLIEPSMEHIRLAGEFNAKTVSLIKGGSSVKQQFKHHCLHLAPTLLRASRRSLGPRNHTRSNMAPSIVGSVAASISAELYLHAADGRRSSVDQCTRTERWAVRRALN